MSTKPNLQLATLNLISEVEAALPLYESDTFVCGPTNTCIGCPKKLLELVESELSYWKSAIKRERSPNFEEFRKLVKLCKNVHRGLKRNQWL
ncbi:hypothetical protein [Paraferrimonas sp. SM1919]|uniref:hypothetical protein n=1 Tax=Paraferrimonas sp. SM1919 TaxID=2662263 RepID=UPI0013D180B6|nr:hypothetical protein [Paraferrimonas sp. SM1919]